jgi:hypothetical protein
MVGHILVASSIIFNEIHICLHPNRTFDIPPDAVMTVCRTACSAADSISFLRCLVTVIETNLDVFSLIYRIIGVRIPATAKLISFP